MATIIKIQEISEEKKAEYLKAPYQAGITLAFFQGLIPLEALDLQSIRKAAEAFADFPVAEDDPLSFLHESREMTISSGEEMIKIRLKELMPAVYYSLYPMSRADLDREYSKYDDNLIIA